MQQVHGHDTLFALHEECLHIGRRAIEHYNLASLDAPATSSLSILNTLLQDRYRDQAKSTRSNDLIASNDLFDLCTATETGGPRSVVGLSLLEWWASDYEVCIVAFRRSSTDKSEEVLYGSSQCTGRRYLRSSPAKRYHSLHSLPAVIYATWSSVECTGAATHRTAKSCLRLSLGLRRFLFTSFIKNPSEKSVIRHQLLAREFPEWKWPAISLGS